MYDAKRKEHLVCRLKKSMLYGLKQSPRCLNAALNNQLKQMGFTESHNNPCIYHKKIGVETFYIAVYVDDIILAGLTEETILYVTKAELSKKFEIKDLGELNYFLGIKV